MINKACYVDFCIHWFSGNAVIGFVYKWVDCWSPHESKGRFIHTYISPVSSVPSRWATWARGTWGTRRAWYWVWVGLGDETPGDEYEVPKTAKMIRKNFFLVHQGFIEYSKLLHYNQRNYTCPPDIQRCQLTGQELFIRHFKGIITALFSDFYLDVYKRLFFFFKSRHVELSISAVRHFCRDP